MTIFEGDYPHVHPPLRWLDRWFAPDIWSAQSYVIARWIWLRALGAIFCSAFYSLWFQIHGLIGENGILPARDYLVAVRRALGLKGFWLVPSLLWIDAGDAALTAIVIAGLLASIAILFNLWPRLSIAIAAVCFLSFVAAAQDFSAYQSDGMLLEAALVSIFFAPRGLRPGLAADRPPSRASHFMLLWEWFRIYFESGVVKILSGEQQWRDLTAMDKYYENGPLPSWIGWYVQQLPHGVHASVAALTLIVELLVCWLVFFPKKSRLIAFIITTPLQIGIILTANYAFLNYLVLFLGVLLLDDSLFRRPRVVALQRPASIVAAIVLIVLFFTTITVFLLPTVPIVNATAIALEPFRVANAYGLFAVMTRARYEIEFQGSSDGRTWIAYPFRHKPQDVRKAPGVYAPYQPRFDWNLWFASLATWQEDRWVLNAQVRLLENQRDVLQLFAGNPFAKRPPIAVRCVLWQYWFTTREQRTRSGAWWNRRLIGDYSPTARRYADGSVGFE